MAGAGAGSGCPPWGGTGGIHQWDTTQP
ncbi:hypothetical protein VULLAG_LOCUS23109 [Vulpes lagopus]